MPDRIHLKSQLLARPHIKVPGQTVFEVWYNGAFIATVNGGDGPGVRIITKHTAEVEAGIDPLTGLTQIEVRIDTK